MKKTFITLFICLISVVGIMGQNRMVEPEVTIIESSDSGITLKFTLNEYRFDEVETPRGVAYLPIVEKSSSKAEKGEPDLPSVVKSLIIPDQGNVEATVLTSDFETLSGMEIAPSKGVIYRNQNPADVPYVYGDMYEVDTFFPYVLCAADEPYIMRDVRGTNIEFSPFAYNAVTKELKVYSEIVVEIKFDNKKSINEIIRPKTNQSSIKEFNNIYDRLFLNASSSQTRYTSLEENPVGKLLIITADTYAEAMTDYINWKREKGIATEMVLASEITAGTLTGTNLKSYIQGRYDEDSDLCYILLVGDADDIPPYSSSSGDSDYYYVRLAGSDGYADAFIGRFSGNSEADIKTQVDRTVYYEKNLNETDTWLGNAFGSASSEGQGGGHNGESDIQHMNLIKADLENYGYSVTHVNQGGSNTTISNTFNTGVGVADYIGHGSDTYWVNTTYSNTHVNALTNDNRLPFIWSVACVNGNFKNQTCFAEAWLRATNDETGAPTGAIAFLGSTINQTWQAPMDAQDEMIDILTGAYSDNVKRTIAGLSFNGMFKMIQLGKYEAQKTADTWVLFGDPSLMVRTKTPSAMDLTYDAQIVVKSTNVFEVKSDTEDALVCLSQEDSEGNVTIISSGLVKDGVANLPIDFEEPMECKLTVTGFDKEIVQDVIYVIVADGPYVVKAGHEVSDSDGNNNGIIEYGERIKIQQSLKNVGVEAAQNLTIEMEVEGYEGIVTNNPITLEKIDISSIVELSDAFVLNITKDITDPTSLPILLTIKDESGHTWTTNYTLQAFAPEVKVVSTRVDDDASGNKDRMLTVGETAKVYMTVRNDGTASLAGKVQLRTNDDVTVVSAEDTMAETQTGESTTVEFEVKINETFSYDLKAVDFELYFVDMDRSTDANFLINLPIENWESNTFSNFEWNNTSEVPWTITSDEKYEGNYSVRSGEITHKGKTTLMIEMEIPEAGTIEFYKKVSSEGAEPTYYDHFTFYIDDVKMGQWGGEVDWSLESFNVEAGKRTFKWEYAKDASMSDGSDCVWIDQIQFPTSVFTPPVGIGTVENGASNMAIYPNPSDGNFSVKVQESAQLRIIDLTGKIVYETSLQSGLNNVSIDVAKGAYMVQVISENAKTTDKIIIK